MSFIQRAVKVPPNSVSLEEARHRVFDFFRAACRSIPTVMEIYNLDDVVAPSHLRSVVASEIRKNSSVTNPKVSLSLSLPSNYTKRCRFIIRVKCLEFRICLQETFILQSNWEFYYEMELSDLVFILQFVPSLWMNLGWNSGIVPTMSDFRCSISTLYQNFRKFSLRNTLFWLIFVAVWECNKMMVIEAEAFWYLCLTEIS